MKAVSSSTAKKPPAGEDHSKRPIRVEGHPAQWLRGGEAGEGRVLGTGAAGGRDLGGAAHRRGRSGRVKASSGSGHGFLLNTADLWCPR